MATKATLAMRQVNLKHGHAGTNGRNQTGTYKTWSMMKNRCLNPKARNYSFYGGRGIKICDRWLEFSNFLLDMGIKPKGTSIDRIDNTKGYFKENCRWGTVKDQARNRRSSRLETVNGKTQTLIEWSEERQINYKTLANRLYLGWTIEEALEL